MIALQPKCIVNWNTSVIVYKQKGSSFPRQTTAKVNWNYSVNEFNVHGSVHRKNILIYVYIQQNATLHSLFYLETALHVSGGGPTGNM
jgi:hypothetical protein